MTFPQARTISLANKLHVRRESWAAEKWFYWKTREVAYVIITNGTEKERSGNQIVRCFDYGEADLLATDWTTMPAALMDCPIDPTIGSTGGGPPVPGFGAFPDNGGSFPPKPGVPGSGSGGGPTVYPPLPTPTPGIVTGISVEFSGIHDQDDQDPGNLGYVAHLNLNRTVAFGLSGGTVHFQSGYQPNEPDDDSGNEDVLNWTVTAELSGGLWTVTLANDDNPLWGGFQTAEPKKTEETIFNAITEESFIRGGKAVVSVIYR